jgi:hypothetical protein
MKDMSLKQQNNDTTEKDIQISDKPVAWMLVDKNWNDACRYFSFPMENAIPLYTAPKELSDEEMLEVYKKVFNKKNEFKENLKRRSYFDFARAILKKASEK